MHLMSVPGGRELVQRLEQAPSRPEPADLDLGTAACPLVGEVQGLKAAYQLMGGAVSLLSCLAWGVLAPGTYRLWIGPGLGANKLEVGFHSDAGRHQGHVAGVPPCGCH